MTCNIIIIQLPSSSAKHGYYLRTSPSPPVVPEIQIALVNFIFMDSLNKARTKQKVFVSKTLREIYKAKSVRILALIAPKNSVRKGYYAF